MASSHAASLFCLVLSSTVATSVRASIPSAPPPAPEQPIRASRPLVVSLSPDLFVLHPGEFGGDATALPALRLTANVTSRLALTASYGGLPDFLTQFDLGLNVNFFTTPFTPYAGVSAGAIIHPADDIPGHTDPFVIALGGVSYVTHGGLDLAVEGGGGYLKAGPSDFRQPGQGLLRFGVRVGYRFGGVK